ncbi:MAG TPA: heme-copper oxidase subunit III [Polyangia bacterium]|nr:heme-copper oxidase subunit III [Polyangia bacterium]
MSASVARAEPDADEEGVPAGKLGMWMFLATDAMGFFGLLVAYAVLRVHADEWPDAHERLQVAAAAVMTGVLVTSSFTMTLAARAAAAGREGARVAWLLMTLALGAAFLGGQALEYRGLLTDTPAMGLRTDTFASTFYAITGYHGLHVFVGLLLIIGALVAGRARPRAVEVIAIFWHFVDLAWIPIFTFVYLLPVT